MIGMSEKPLSKESVCQRGTRGAVRSFDPNGAVRFVLSTERRARDNNIIRADAWRTKNFAANPVALWAHKDTELPIGHWRDLKIESMPEGDPALFGDLHFASAEYEFAATVEKLYRSGALNAVSVRWTPLDYERMEDGSNGIVFTDVDLLEVSAVPVPADPDAIAVAAQRGIVTPDELEKFEARLGSSSEILILGSEIIVDKEQERATEEVVEVVEAEEVEVEEQRAEEVAEDVVVAEESSDDVVVEDDVEPADSADEVRSEEPVEEPAEERSADPVAEEDCERAGKKISSGRAKLIRETIDTISASLEALKDMIDEADPREMEEEEGEEGEWTEDERGEGEKLVDELVSEERSEDPCPEPECCDEEPEDCPEVCCDDEERADDAEGDYVREILGTLNDIRGIKSEEEQEAELLAAFEEVKNSL